MTLEGYCSGDGAARCVLLTLRARGLLHAGHVLGLRVLFRWDITSMSQRGVRGFLEDALALAMMTPRLSAALHVVAEFVEVWQQAAAARGCHIAFWAKATPRVDVGDTPNTMGSASSRCGLWLGNLDNVGEEEREKEKEKDVEKEEIDSTGSSSLFLLPGFPSYALWSQWVVSAPWQCSTWTA